MEGGISGAEDKLEEIDSSTKENLNSNKSLKQNIQEMWDIMKRPNLRIIGIEEVKEPSSNVQKIYSTKSLSETFPI